MRTIVGIDYDPTGYFLQVGDHGAGIGECIVQWVDACESDLIILQERAEGVRAMAFVWDREVFPCSIPRDAVLETEPNGRVRFIFSDNPGVLCHQFLAQDGKYLTELWWDGLEGVTQVAVTPLETSVLTAPAESRTTVRIEELGDLGVAQLRPASKNKASIIRPHTQFEDLGALMLEEVDGIITAVLLDHPDQIFGPDQPTHLRVELPRNYPSAWRLCFTEVEVAEVWNIYSTCGRYQFILSMGEMGLASAVVLPRGHCPG
ncbi:MAG: hypothetical protein Q4P33_08750 [Flaviflexus sp.]|nr:hypothetical protein [Flaviflexus sp.]